MNADEKYTSRTKEQTQELIERWKQSGKSKKLFAQDNGINYMTFIGWFSRDTKKKPSKEKPSFISVPMKTASGQLFAELHFKNGTRVSFYQPVGAEYFQSLL